MLNRTSFVLYFTDKCNWKCPYCDLPHWKLNNKQSISLKNLEEQLNLIKKTIPTKFELVLQGGEIGLLSKQHLELIENILSEYPLILNTNGAAFGKINYDSYKKIIYHVVQEITENATIIDVPYVDADNKFEKVAVVHKNNIHLIQTFLENNINQIENLQLKCYSVRNGSNLLLTLEQLLELKQLSIKYPQLGPISHVDRKLNNPKSNWKNYQSICSTRIIPTPMINLVDNTIHRCCISMHTNTAKLTKYNLQQLVKNHNIFDSNFDPVCASCDKFPNINEIKQILFQK